MPGRRGNYEGSFRQRPNGLWEVRFTLNGKQVSRYGKTREDVVREMRRAQHDEEKGLPFENRQITVGQLLDYWLEQTAKATVAPRTYDSYESYCRVHIKPSIGRLRLHKLQPHHVQTLMNERLSEGLSPATVVKIRAILRRALNVAKRWGVIQRNAAELVDPPKIEHVSQSVWLPGEAHAFLQAVRGDRLEALYALTLSAGLRQSEALGLSWKNIDFERRTIMIEQTLQRIGGRLTLTATKTQKSRKTLKVTRFAIDLLREHKSLQSSLRRAAGENWKEHGLVFTTSVGTPFDGPNVSRYFRRAVEQAGLPPMPFKNLRHACATYLLWRGIDLKTVSEILRHSDIRVTANTYAQVIPPLMDSAVDQLDEVFGSTTQTLDDKDDMPNEDRDLGYGLGYSQREHDVHRSANAQTSAENRGATRRTRTGDLRITNALRLYIGIVRRCLPAPVEPSISTHAAFGGVRCSCPRLSPVRVETRVSRATVNEGTVPRRPPCQASSTASTVETSPQACS